MIALSGCGGYTALTPNDLTRLGTRSFPRCTVVQASAGSATAFKTLGYTVTRNDTEGGVVKTGPRVIFTESRATAKHYETLGPDESKLKATSQRDALSWTARSTADATGVQIVLSPRAYRNGVEQTGPAVFVKEVMDPHFQQVWREIEDEMEACR